MRERERESVWDVIVKRRTARGRHTQVESSRQNDNSSRYPTALGRPPLHIYRRHKSVWERKATCFKSSLNRLGCAFCTWAAAQPKRERESVLFLHTPPAPASIFDRVRPNWREREKRQAGTVSSSSSKRQHICMGGRPFCPYISSALFIIIICGASGAEAEGNMPDRHERRSADRTAV